MRKTLSNCSSLIILEFYEFDQISNKISQLRMSAGGIELRERRENTRTKQAVTLEVSYTTCAGEFEAELVDPGVEPVVNDTGSTSGPSEGDSRPRPLSNKSRSSSVPSAEVGGWEAHPLVAYGPNGPNADRQRRLGRVHEADVEGAEQLENEAAEDPPAPRGSTADMLDGPDGSDGQGVVVLGDEAAIDQKETTHADLAATMAPAVINAFRLATTALSTSVSNALLSSRTFLSTDASVMNNEHVTDANRMKTDYGLGVSTEVRSRYIGWLWDLSVSTERIIFIAICIENWDHM